tara:strand:- start:452 stop:1018 length:567 start_codon:yes stop_codon:yes gene_type:complete
MPLTERDIRKVINTKQSTVEFDGIPSPSSMIEGQVALHKKSNTLLALYRKKFGKLWKTYLSTNGDQVVDKNLEVKGKTKSRVTAKDLVFEKGPTLEIANGAITVTHSLHEVEVQGASGNDDLDTINGGVDGQILILRAFNGGRTVTIKHNEDNIFLPGGSDFDLDTGDDVVVCLKNQSDWFVIVTTSI